MFKELIETEYKEYRAQSPLQGQNHLTSLIVATSYGKVNLKLSRVIFMSKNGRCKTQSTFSFYSSNLWFYSGNKNYFDYFLLYFIQMEVHPKEDHSRSKSVSTGSQCFVSESDTLNYRPLGLVLSTRDFSLFCFPSRICTGIVEGLNQFNIRRRKGPLSIQFLVSLRSYSVIISTTVNFLMWTVNLHFLQLNL